MSGEILWLAMVFSLGLIIGCLGTIGLMAMLSGAGDD